jgi:hypothetical protein
MYTGTLLNTRVVSAKRIFSAGSAGLGIYSSFGFTSAEVVKEVSSSNVPEP